MRNSLQLSISSYSFARLLHEGVVTMEGLPAFSKMMGYEGVEFIELSPPEGTPPEGTDVLSYARDLRARCEKAGLPVTCYSVGADFLKGSQADCEKEVARVCRQVDVAKALGAPLMRHDAAAGPGTTTGGFMGALPRLARACRAVTEYAQTQGVRTMVENHGFFCQDSLRVEQLVTRVAHENFGLLVDIGNFLCVDEDPVLAVSRTAPYAFYVHVKDFHVKSGSGPNPGEGFFTSRGGNYLRGAIVGHGDVPVGQCLAALKRAGYKGYVTLEYEGLDQLPLALTIGFKNMQVLLE